MPPKDFPVEFAMKIFYSVLLWSTVCQEMKIFVPKKKKHISMKFEVVYIEEYKTSPLKKFWGRGFSKTHFHRIVVHSKVGEYRVEASGSSQNHFETLNDQKTLVSCIAFPKFEIGTTK